MTTPLAGERVRTARHLLGVSQEELARASALSQALISQVENGVRTATDEVLDAVARATSMPRAFFDAVPPELPPGSLRFRKLASARRGDIRRVEALLGEAFRIVTHLMVDAKYPSPVLPVQTETPGDEEIERLADETRTALGIGLDAPVRHVTRACERGGVAVVPLNLPGDDSQEGEAVGHFGASFWPGRGEPALIGYFSNGTGDRQRFTLGHELGHLVLHSRRRMIADAEREAHRFAGAFLLPRERMIEAMGTAPLTLGSLMRMKATWGASIQALIMRGNHLGLIDERRKTSLFKQLSARQWRKSEPVIVHPEEPALMWTLLESRYGPEATRSRVVAERVGISAHVLRSIAPQPTS